jgi:hypothetical protein
MFKRVILVTLGLTAVGGTALACNEYTKPKVEKISVHSGDSINHNKTCTNVLIGKGDQRICPPKATPTPVQSPPVTPKPTRSPKATPTPVVTPSPAPSVTPAASQTVKSAAPTVLPSVGGSGRVKP